MTSTPTIKEYRPGQFLFHEGTQSDCMYLIKKGTVGIRKRKGSAWVEIARVYANEVLGELSFFDRQPRSASAVALTEVEVIELKFDGLDKLWNQIPDYLKTIMASVAERLRKANDSIRRLKKDTINEADDQKPMGAASPTAADVIAATANILSDEMMGITADAAKNPDDNGGKGSP
jgi:CRP/FNR family cyclic AMP-dependent transcriptional regulator